MNSTKATILLVDDEVDILEFLSYNLEKENYKVFTAINGKEALEIMEMNLPHLVLLDIMMPVLDGIETCKAIRENKKYDDVLISFLSARNEDLVEIKAMDTGADNYLTKPIQIPKLMSHIKAMLRRHPLLNNSGPGDEISFADVTILPSNFEVRKNGKLLELSRKEFNILNLLCSRMGKVYKRQEIYREIWGTDILVGERTLDVHISKLRDKIGKQYIKTVKGVGYKLDV